MADLSLRYSAVERRLKCAPLYARAQEAGLDNPPWEAATGRFLVVRLSPWRDVDRSTPHLFLHRLVRSGAGNGAYVDFAFFPSKADRACLDAEGLPWLSGILSRRTAEDFDAVLVSLSYALELVNLPSLFLHSGIPVRASQRRGSFAPTGAAWPLIILGGSSALACQGALFPDGDAFFDAAFFGEGEDGGSAILRSLAETRGLPTEERLAALERTSASVWAAGFGAPGKPRIDGSIRRVRPGRCRLIPRPNAVREVGDGSAGEEGPLLLDSYPLLNSDEASTARFQISWGCPSFCAFCFEGWERKPYRELPLDRILASAAELAANTGASTLELYSFNFNAHEHALQLILELNRLFDRVNMMSQRADILANTPQMLAVELAGEKRSFTVGVEGISASMRAYYSKGLGDDELQRLLERLVREKIRELKLFYIIAGIEGEADLAEFRSFCAELKNLIDTRGTKPRIVFSAGYLVRMPFTPLRGAALALDRRPIERIAAELKDAVEAQGFEFRLAQDWEEYVADQLVVAGGYGLAGGIEEAAAGGAVYDAGIQGNLVGPLVRALRASGELAPPASGGAEAGNLFGPLVESKGSGWTYPLDFVDPSVPGDFLDRCAEGAELRGDLVTCMGDETGDGACLGCSACEDKEERAALTAHRIRTAAPSLAERVSELIKEKRRMRAIHLRIVLPPTLEGWRPAFLSAYLTREIFRRERSLVGRLFRVEEALWDSPLFRDRIGPGTTGESVIALFGIGGAGGAGNSCLSTGDAELIRAAVEDATGAPASLLETFSPEEAAAIRAAVGVSEGTEALRRIRSWLAGLRVAATERKTPHGRVFEIAPKDRKKRIVENVEFRQTGEGGRILVSGGVKLDLSSLLPPGVFATEVAFSRR